MFISMMVLLFSKIYPDKSPSVTKVNSFTESGEKIFIVNIEGYDGQKTVDLIIKDKDHTAIQNDSNKVNVTKIVSDEKSMMYTSISGLLKLLLMEPMEPSIHCSFS